MTVSNYTLAHELPHLFPGLREVVSCPECQTPESVFSVIQHLNDFHSGWSRERIADWLESLDTDLNMIEGEKYDSAIADINQNRDLLEQRPGYSPATQALAHAVVTQAEAKMYASILAGPLPTPWSGQTQEELLKERINDALQNGIVKVQESLTQLGESCASALEAIQKFAINYEEIVKKEQTT